MIAYLDTSALLRIVLRESNALDDLRTYDGLVSSELIAVESARAIDRLRNQGALTMDEAAERIGLVNEFIREVEKGLAQIDAGQVLRHDAVGTRLAQKLAEHQSRR